MGKVSQSHQMMSCRQYLSIIRMNSDEIFIHFALYLPRFVLHKITTEDTNLSYLIMVDGHRLFTNNCVNLIWFRKVYILGISPVKN